MSIIKVLGLIHFVKSKSRYILTLVKPWYYFQRGIRYFTLHFYMLVLFAFVYIL
jgi:hypothetical protein